jgi:methionine-rich copper-binding protein CopC
MTRALLCGFGLILSLLGLNEIFTSRAHFITSNPEPGKSLYAPLTAVTVTFSDELAPESTISIVTTVTLKPSGDLSYSGGEKVSTSSAIDIYDPKHRTLKAILMLEPPNGLYRVDWTAIAAKNKAGRFGSYYYAAGMAIPDHILKEGKNSLQEEDINYFDEINFPESAVFAGLILVLIGVFWNYLPKRSPRY